jgi:hypothetical protein
LAIVGLMVGMMIGRLTTPDPTAIAARRARRRCALAVWFSDEPKLHGEMVDGTVGLLFDAQGKAQNGAIDAQ